MTTPSDVPPIGAMLHVNSQHFAPTDSVECFPAVVVRHHGNGWFGTSAFVPANHGLALDHFPVASAHLSIHDTSEWHRMEDCPSG